MLTPADTPRSPNEHVPSRTRLVVSGAIGGVLLALAVLQRDIPGARFVSAGEALALGAIGGVLAALGLRVTRRWAADSVRRALGAYLLSWTGAAVAVAALASFMSPMSWRVLPTFVASGAILGTAMWVEEFRFLRQLRSPRYFAPALVVGVLVFLAIIIAFD